MHRSLENGAGHKLEITEKWIREWAEKYDKENAEEKTKEDKILKSIKALDSPPRYLTKDVLMEIAYWKASRAKGYIDGNDPRYVEEITRISLTTRNEKLRLEVLTLLKGVGIRRPQQFFISVSRSDIRLWIGVFGSH